MEVGMGHKKQNGEVEELGEKRECHDLSRLLAQRSEANVFD